MVERGDIMVERLTGRRTIVIHATGPEEVNCRFDDGRLEDRFTFELERPQSSLATLLSWLFAFVNPWEQRPEPERTWWADMQPAPAA